MVTEPNPQSSELAALIHRAGGIATTAQALGLSYVTVYAWARGYHGPCGLNLLRLRELPTRATSSASIPPLRPRRVPPSQAQIATIGDAIRRAGGRTVAARALGVSYATVRSWERGSSSPRAGRLQQLLALPAGKPLRPGCPKRRRIVDPSLVDRVVEIAGSHNAASRALGVSRVTLRRYVQRRRELSPAVIERARQIIATRELVADAAAPTPCADAP